MYKTIVADPPWKYGAGRAILPNYRVFAAGQKRGMIIMTVEDSFTIEVLEETGEWATIAETGLESEAWKLYDRWGKHATKARVKKTSITILSAT